MAHTAQIRKTPNADVARFFGTFEAVKIKPIVSQFNAMMPLAVQHKCFAVIG